MSDNAGLIAAVVIVGAGLYYAWPSAAVPEYDGMPETGEGDTAPDLQDYALQAVDTVSTMFEGEDVNNPNVAAFLYALRLGEGTSGPEGYRIKCGGGTFDSYAAHPAALGWPGFGLSERVCALAGFGPGCVSTAAGAYQINKPTWNRVRAIIGATDFSPEWQDAAAIQLIREKGALADVMAGRTAAAVNKVRKVWASLPGAGYGQREITLQSFNNQYRAAGGVLA